MGCCQSGGSYLLDQDMHKQNQQKCEVEYGVMYNDEPSDSTVLHRILDGTTHPLRPAFVRFCKNECSMENVGFMNDLSRLEREKPGKQKDHFADEVYYRYISDDAPCMVNISGPTRIELKGIFEVDPKVKKGTSGIEFDKAKSEIFGIILTDTFARFQTGVDWSRWSNQNSGVDYQHLVNLQEELERIREGKVENYKEAMVKRLGSGIGAHTREEKRLRELKSAIEIEEAKFEEVLLRNNSKIDKFCKDNLMKKSQDTESQNIVTSKAIGTNTQISSQEEAYENRQ